MNKSQDTKRQALRILAGATLIALVGTTGVAVAQTATKPTIAPPAIELEPKALNILKGASDKLAAAKTLSFKGVVSEESPSRLGPPLVYTSRYNVTLHRPDKLRVLNPGDGSASDLYYDGKSLVAFAPRENYVARMDAPPSIDGALETALKKAQIYYPFADLIVADPYKGLSDGLRVAFYVGESDSVGGTKTHIVAYANDHAFVQAWIGVEDRLPRRLRAVYRTDPVQLRHEMEITDWKLDEPVLPETFKAPEATKKALPIPFDSPTSVSTAAPK
jgi:hypothetical protein